MQTHLIARHAIYLRHALEIPAGTSANNVQPGITSHLLEATPLLLAAFYYLLAPFFSDLVRQRFIVHLEKMDREWSGPEVQLPPHLTSAGLEQNIDWVIDAPQMVPGLLLPLAGAIFAFRDSDLSAIILAFATISICAAALWIYSQSPVKYQSIRFAGHRYTLVAALGVLLNGIAAVVLLIR